MRSGFGLVIPTRALPDMIALNPSLCIDCDLFGTVHHRVTAYNQAPSDSGAMLTKPSSPHRWVLYHVVKFSKPLRACPTRVIDKPFDSVVHLSSGVVNVHY